MKLIRGVLMVTHGRKIDHLGISKQIVLGDIKEVCSYEMHSEMYFLP